VDLLVLFPSSSGKVWVIAAAAGTDIFLKQFYQNFHDATKPEEQQFQIQILSDRRKMFFFQLITINIFKAVCECRNTYDNNGQVIAL
jgi:hypothetical protein